MGTVVRKWGNSLGVRIPSLCAKEFNLKHAPRRAAATRRTNKEQRP